MERYEPFTGAGAPSEQMESGSITNAPTSEALESALVLACRKCGAKNPTRGSELSTRRQCPACTAELAPLAEPLDVDAGGLVAVVTSAGVPVLIDFWAPWCPPCRVAGPIIRKVAADLAGKALVLKVDVDQQPALAAEFGVRALPTFIVIRNRQVVKQHPGLAMPGTIKRWLVSEMHSA